MNKTELIKAVAEESNISNREATTVVNAVLNQIMTAVKNGEEVALPGFGTFGTKNVPARTGEFRGVKYETKEHKAPTFRPGAVFKKDL